MFKIKANQTIARITHCNKSTKLFYLSSLFVPAIILLFIRFIYLSDHFTLYPHMLTTTALPCCAFASFAFAYYLRHSHMLPVNDCKWQLALSAAYGLCSYGITQETNACSLILYAAFPLLFLTFEKMVCQVCYLPFVVACAFMLLLQPSAGLPIFLLLFILAMIELYLQKQLTLGNVVHILCCFLLSMLLGAARILYYLAPAITDHASYAYQGFSFALEPTIFLTRFLPFTASSLLYVDTTGRMDLYCGLFFLLTAISFFFQTKINKTKKLYYGIFLLLIIAVIELSPLHYAFSFFMDAEDLTMTCSFFLLFWILRLASETIPLCKNFSKASIVTSSAIMILWGCISWLWCSNNFSRIAIISIILFGTLYIFLLLCDQAIKLPNIPVPVWYTIILLELTANCFICTNINFLSSYVTADSRFYIQEKQENISKEDPQEEIYNNYLSSHQDEYTETLLSLVPLADSLTDEEIKRYSDTLLPDIFERLNILCYKSGIEDPLFEPYNATLSFDNSELYQITDQGDNLYNIDITTQVGHSDRVLIPFEITAPSTNSSSVYYLENYSGELIKTDQKMLQKSAKGYLYPTPLEATTYNVKFSFYTMDTTVYKQLSSIITDLTETEKKQSNQLIIYDYAGVALSYIGMMLLAFLCLYNDKDTLYKKLYRGKMLLNSLSFPGKVYAFIQKNKIYILSFLIPVLLYLICMIATDCMPFGENSFYDSDGLGLNLPIFMDNYYKYQYGNHFLSMNEAYGFDLSIYYTISVLAKIYHFLPISFVAPALLFFIGICLGFCSLTMTYYMTHRLSGRAINKQEPLLLIPAMVYSINAYIITCHCFPTWYFTLILFPLLMAATDKMMIEKHSLKYILLLGLCILVEIQLAMFMCIYLVIRFFTYHFDSFKDFIKKGARFAASSLLAGGCGFLVVYRTITLYKSTLYTAKDSNIPTPGLHTSFLEQWKKLMFLTPTSAVSTNDGDLTVYCGILTLLLVLVYFTSKKIRLTDKLRRLIPIIILTISFNGKLLSWLWNGLHYQSSVPNRYVFLLLFLFAELAYDSIRLLDKLSVFKYGILSMLIIIFFFICQEGSSQNTLAAFLFTLTLCMVYLTLHFSQRYQKNSRHYHSLLTFLLFGELGINMLFLTNSWGLTDLNSIYGDYIAQEEFHQTLQEKGSFFRCTFPALNTAHNKGEIFNTPTTCGFNSYISTYQLNLQHQYGLQDGLNCLYADYLSTPVGLSLSGSRYIFVPFAAEHSVSDLSYYHYIGMFSHYYVYENTDALSLGVYVPSKAAQLSQDEAEIAPLFAEKLATLYENDNLFHFQTIAYSDDTTASDSFYFTDSDNNQLTFEEAKEIFMDYNDDTKQLLIHINYTPKNKGYVYFYPYEIIPMKRSVKEQSEHFVCTYPKVNKTFPSIYNIFILDDNVMQQFFQNIQENQWEDIEISNDTITGTTNYKQDGYTMLSIAYSEDWSAYIDGKQVEIENPYDSGIFVKTPAGKHTLELRFTPHGLKTGKLVTCCFWLFVLLLHGIPYFIKRRNASAT